MRGISSLNGIWYGTCNNVTHDSSNLSLLFVVENSKAMSTA